jgi:hypothetical protein
MLPPSGKAVTLTPTLISSWKARTYFSSHVSLLGFVKIFDEEKLTSGIPDNYAIDGSSESVAVFELGP